MQNPTKEISESEMIQIQIVPQRILNPETSEKLLTEIYNCGNIRRVLIQGSRIPAVVGYGPGKGQKVQHHLKKTLNIGGQEVEINVTLSKLYVEVYNKETADKIKEKCENVLPFPFEYYEGVYFKKHSTVVDYAKMGPDADDLLIGMSDPKASVDNIKFIEQKKSDNNC